MAKPTGALTRVFIDGHEITHHVAAVDLKVRPASATTAAVELFNASVDKDPATGALTFHIGTPS